MVLLRLLRSAFLGCMMFFAAGAAGHGALTYPKSRNVLAMEGRYTMGVHLDDSRGATALGINDLKPDSSYGVTSLNNGLFQHMNVPVQKVCGGRSDRPPSEDNPFALPGKVVTPLIPGKVNRIKFCFIFLHPPGRLNAGLCRSDRLQDCLTVSWKEAKRAMPLKFANANGKSKDGLHVYPPPYDGPLWGGYGRQQLDQAWVNANYPPCEVGNEKAGLEVTMEANIPNIECPRCVLAVSWETGTACKFRDSPHDWFRDKYDMPGSYTNWVDPSACTSRNIPVAAGRCGVSEPRPWCWEQIPPEIFHNCADVSIAKNGNGTTPGNNNNNNNKDAESMETGDIVIVASTAIAACIMSTMIFVISASR